MLLKGLDINPFLIQHFIASILTNTSGNRDDVYKFLNDNLNTIINSRRNTQLNKHSFIRFRPFLLNNSATSSFSSVVPYQPDDGYAYELQDLLDSMEEAKKTFASELLKNNNDNIKNITEA